MFMLSHYNACCMVNHKYTKFINIYITLLDNIVNDSSKLGAGYTVISV